MSDNHPVMLSMRRLGLGEGDQEAVRRMIAWSQLERARRARGEPPRSWGDHAARNVLQGILTFDEAWLSLALLLRHTRPNDTGAVTAEEHAKAAVHLAHAMLEAGIRRIGWEREALERRMRSAIQPMFAQWAASEDILSTMQAMNNEAGRLFVWPELRELLNEEAARFMAQQRKRRNA